MTFEISITWVCFPGQHNNLWQKLCVEIKSGQGFLHEPPLWGDGEFLWTVNSRRHFFSKWAKSSWQFQRMNFRGHFSRILVHKNFSFWVNFRGNVLGQFCRHFFQCNNLMVITKSGNTGGQWTLFKTCPLGARVSEFSLTGAGPSSVH